MGGLLVFGKDDDGGEADGDAGLLVGGGFQSPSYLYIRSIFFHLLLIYMCVYILFMGDIYVF